MSQFSIGILNQTGRQYATWSPTNKSSRVSLSLDKLTATGNTTQGGTAITTIGVTSGKSYWEIFINYTSVNPPGAAVEAFGIANLYNNTAVLGAYPNSAGYRRNQGASTQTFLRNFGSGSGFVGTDTPDYATGETIGFKLDLDSVSPTISMVKRNTGTGIVEPLGSTLILPSGQTWYPAFGSDGSSGSVIANFGNSAFAYSVPAGYNPGIYI
jgi:hypothetical protein